MRRMIGIMTLMIVSLSITGQIATGEQTLYPIKVGDNGRYFVDREGKPIFWLGTTQRQLR
jgi:hypothetical protein